ncbi:MAG: hypothetical protein ACREQ5_18665 [Candidatus Dormibacteria bacterium]
MSAEPRRRGSEVVAWDLDSLAPDELQAAYLDISGFVGWLHECDVEVPSCWYVHGWLVRRLAALRHWRDDTLGPEGTAKASADWWSALFRLQLDWSEVHGHYGAHPPREQPWGNPIATPALEDTVSDAVGRRRRVRGGGPPW